MDINFSPLVIANSERDESRPSTLFYLEKILTISLLLRYLYNSMEIQFRFSTSEGSSVTNETIVKCTAI